MVKVKSFNVAGVTFKVRLELNEHGGIEDWIVLGNPDISREETEALQEMIEESEGSL